MKTSDARKHLKGSRKRCPKCKREIPNYLYDSHVSKCRG